MSKWSRDEKKAFNVLAGWSTGLILLITGANAFLIMNSFRKIEGPTETRNIASLQSQTLLIGPEVPVLHLDCQQNKPSIHITTQSSSARIHIQNCPKVKALKNKSNQGLAHLFPLDNGGWTSDFIQLNEGPNSIQVDWEDGQQLLEITRKKDPSLTANKEL